MYENANEFSWNEYDRKFISKANRFESGSYRSGGGFSRDSDAGGGSGTWW